MSWGGDLFSPPNASSATWRGKVYNETNDNKCELFLKNIKYTEKIMMAGMNQRKGKKITT